MGEVLRGFLRSLGVPRRISKNFTWEGFRVEIPRLRQLEKFGAPGKLLRSQSVTLSNQMPGQSISFRRTKSKTPDPGTFENYRDTPPISIAILLQKYALFLAESSMYTTNVYGNAAPICIAILLQKYQGSLEHPQLMS